MKKIGFLKVLLFSFIFLLAFNVNFASAEKESDASTSSVKESDNYTFGEVEAVIVDYLKSEGKEFEVGSNEYTDFIIDQYMNDTDQELVNRVDYKVINAYMSEYVYQFSLYEKKNQSNINSFSADVTFDLNNIKDLTIGEVKEQIANEEAVANVLKNNLPSTLAASAASYSVSNAKGYADKWYNGRNPVYPVFKLDCTNFVSQILFAGGMQMNFNVSSGWYANTLDNSVSWSAVPEFFTYWSQRKSTSTSTSKSTIISDAKAGDIIQLKKDGATRWSHSMFVYEKSNSTLYLSAHTSDYLKKDFKTISTDWVNFRVIKM